MVEVIAAMEVLGFNVDPVYEFAAPKIFDFIRGETDEERRAAEAWFESASGYAPAIARTEEQSLQDSSAYNDQNTHTNRGNSDATSVILSCQDPCTYQEDNTVLDMDICTPDLHFKVGKVEGTTKTNHRFGSKSTLTKPTASYLAKVLDSGVSKTQDVKALKNATSRNLREALLKKAQKTVAEDHQAVKKQKLDGGRLHRVVNLKDHALHHKLPTQAIDRKEPCAVANPCANEKGCMTAKVRKFVSKVPDQHQPNDKLKLTIPKEPDLVTSHRTRPPKVKSSAELEEEMLAKIPKFKALPLNKKILEAPTLPLPQKTAVQFPIFQEFNLKTMERATHYTGATPSVSSSSDSLQMQNQNVEKNKVKQTTGGVLTEPKMPHLETTVRARPPKLKSTEELEKEELEKAPKFKARPLNKRIFSSRGDMGIPRNVKRQITNPVEFHFATQERCHQPSLPVDLFGKLSLNSESSQDPACKKTVPKPFHLLTEERGAEKEKKFRTELQHLQEKEQEARIPKANPLPYTVDYPAIPPKPQPKECTRPEPFQLESLIRHEEEQQRLMEERAKAEKEEMEMRRFRAQPVMSNAPVTVPEVPRLPLTEVQEFTFRVDSRAVERQDFDRKVQEKQMLYQKIKEEHEAFRKAEEERVIKFMRKQMVPHARPMPDFNNPFVPERSSKELTEAKSPKFCLSQRPHSSCGSLSSNCSH